METAQYHIRKGLITTQIMGKSKGTEKSKEEILKIKLKLDLDEVNNSVSIKGHLLKSLLITK